MLSRTVRVLRSRPFRSVVLEDELPVPRILKRFHHPNPFLARLDGARARREFEALTALERAGLPVPRPLELCAGERGFEVRLAAIPHARTLEEWLGAEGAPPGGWARLLARLGTLLARLQLAGWEHGDLHPGNLLVDASGAPWLVDFQRARRAAPDRARLLAQVVECAAVAREALPARLRARFLVAWLATLPPELRPDLTGSALARALEQRARLRRAELVRIGLNRWLRESSRARPVEHGGERAWMRRTLEESRFEVLPPARRLRLEGPRDEILARWLGAARLLEHGLPAAGPALLVPRLPRGRARAVFEVPERGVAAPASALAALAERGLALRRAVLADGPGGLYLRPPREPEDFVAP